MIVKMTNTRLRYMYRDRDNYKLHGEAVFEGLERHGDAEIVGNRLIPDQIGLCDLAELEGWDADDFHWHEVTEIEPTNAAADHGSWAEFVEKMRTITWDEVRRGPWGVELPGYGSISAYLSDKDGVLVIEIDTPEVTEAAGTADAEGVPRMRVNINDDVVFAHPPYPAD